MSTAQQSTGARVVERVPMDRFENAIREVGIVAACEWFGHAPNSEFTKDTIRLLAERATANPEDAGAAA